MKNMRNVLLTVTGKENEHLMKTITLKNGARWL